MRSIEAFFERVSLPKEVLRSKISPADADCIDTAGGKFSKCCASAQGSVDIIRLIEIVALWAKKIPAISQSNFAFFDRFGEAANISIGVSSIPAFLFDCDKLASRILDQFEIALGYLQKGPSHAQNESANIPEKKAGKLRKLFHNAQHFSKKAQRFPKKARKLFLAAQAYLEKGTMEYVAYVVKSCFLQMLSLTSNAMQIVLFFGKAKIMPVSPGRIAMCNLVSNLASILLSASEINDQRLHLSSEDAEKRRLAWIALAKNCASIFALTIDMACVLSRRASQSSALATGCLFFRTAWLSFKISAHFMRETAAEIPILESRSGIS